MRHLSIRDDTGKTSFELIYKRFTDINRFEQKMQKRKNRSDTVDWDSSDSPSESESDTDATPRKKKKKRKKGTVPPSGFESDDST